MFDLENFLKNTALSYKEYKINPVPKPRMTQRDKWNKRPSVMRYRRFKDEIIKNKVFLPHGEWHVVFIIPLPRSWSESRKAKLVHQPHQATPDKDNLEKALLDAIFGKDQFVWDGRVSKFWGNEGAIIIGEKKGNRI